MTHRQRYEKRRGQVMLLATVFIVGTLVAASLVAGLLAILQLRQTADVKFSAAAVGGADAAIEYALYEFFQPSSTVDAFNASPPAGWPTLSDGAAIESYCYSDYGGTTAVSCTDPSARLIRGVGHVGNIRRAFELQLNP